ncbi:hypothetical protein PUNSTDRAFT_25719, partial [Punctularia strigosozonata HHB-11173 SS5]|uniref:uncharacterized protein n=1 Tax=Punctularia strigosozonata (strain HHB-11173) TaxID=741275 RepID=UPI0004417551
PQNPANRRPPLFEDGLTNTIVLAGPHGCGKTAAVYACAAELGWEVFEVYPGIGKRSGTNLDNLVGEVGKNHLVNSAKRKVTGLNDALPAKVGGLSLFNGEVSANPAGEDNRPRKKRLRKAGEEVQEVAASITQVEAANVDADRPTSVRQSIILLEEVDILYKEDANFWPSVVELIRNCRRPVVMTCNDPLLIPVDTLPIQTTLRFISCEPALAVSYLQMLCLAEGYCVDRD